MKNIIGNSSIFKENKLSSSSIILREFKKYIYIYIYYATLQNN